MKKQVKNNVSWVGYIDWELEKFHGDEYSILNGSSQNAYLIQEGKTVLIDTVWAPSADVFRAAALPDESIRTILAYGAVNPGNDAFPKELFTAQAVLTCTPFDPSNHTEKINNAFLENQELYQPFEVAATFDMGNGYTITAYRRVKEPTVEELDTYRRWLAEIGRAHV